MSSMKRWGVLSLVMNWGEEFLFVLFNIVEHLNNVNSTNSFLNLTVYVSKVVLLCTEVLLRKLEHNGYKNQ